METKSNARKQLEPARLNLDPATAAAKLSSAHATTQKSCTIPTSGFVREGRNGCGFERLSRSITRTKLPSDQFVKCVPMNTGDPAVEFVTIRIMTRSEPPASECDVPKAPAFSGVQMTES